ncbi:hypothetical protein CDAR_518921 [Caerostris darwini]|uniref:Uncharacterized protein n=1 Tax=Caerostris darwini TaxID=1538125 RepID=A0AAV4PPJ7_9ARAC|nr:hypothetical protein CDAR_518921 [Caerostris darwini]
MNRSINAPCSILLQVSSEWQGKLCLGRQWSKGKEKRKVNSWSAKYIDELLIDEMGDFLSVGYKRGLLIPEKHSIQIQENRSFRHFLSDTVTSDGKLLPQFSLLSPSCPKPEMNVHHQRGDPSENRGQTRRSHFVEEILL